FDSDAQLSWLENFGIEDANRKMLWKILAALLLAISFLIFITYQVRRPKVPKILKLKSKVESALKKSGVAFTPAEAPLSVRAKVPTDSPTLAFFDTYLSLR